MKKRMARLICFSIISLCLFCALNHILTYKDSKKTIYSLRYEKKDSMEVVFFGNSHANNAFLPMELWNEYGYTAYSMSMMAQSFPLVYYCAEDAIRLQHPKLLIVDLFASTSYSNDFDLMHKTIDNLTFRTRVKAIHEFVADGIKMEYYFPFFLYHGRWSSIEKKDFIPYFMRYSPRRNARKGATLVSGWKPCEKPEHAIEYANNGEGTELSEDALFWYSRLKELCDSNGVQLLFTVVPYQMPVQSTEGATIENMKWYNATEKWCRDNQVGYYNMFCNLDEMEFDFSEDMQDESHVNILGAEKVTKCIGEYIYENYSFEDLRDNESIKKDWDEFYMLYEVEKDTAVTQCRDRMENEK